jgi:hypothetical protein
MMENGENTFPEEEEWVDKPPYELMFAKISPDNLPDNFALIAMLIREIEGHQELTEEQKKTLKIKLFENINAAKNIGRLKL